MALRILRKGLIFLVSLGVASVVVFAFMAVLPGDPARVALGTNATPEAVAQMHERYGTDRPVLVQYWDWVSGLATGDFGRSYVSGAEIGPQILDRLQVTLWLVLSGMLVALLIALPLGVAAAMRHRHLSGTLLSGFSQLGVAVPNFLVGIMLITLFAVHLRWLPSGGWTAPAEDPGAFARRLVLPAVSLGLVQGAILTRYVRSAILDVLREDYLRTARAKGMRPYQALVRHGLRNAAIPVVTVLALQLATLLIGAVVIERVFVIPGLGSLLLDGVGNRDLLLVQGVVMVLVLAVLLLNFVVDVLYTALDPRIRMAAR
ncbi:peptide/nickel transport system permease protein [Lipingzhangella halophila]|uniref:Peptide/nickel transport system permease protein n=1 Tax=Lipingzhangella halophila TaxID=1783352 RepID=A0A7W7W488_9ACTN|nr:ABC transporter permease [Lipingzhangella halophila]MBB4933343.1 peptide/nickel transport system permease protein [Lipingzhangella halophila]